MLVAYCACCEELDCACAGAPCPTCGLCEMCCPFGSMRDGSRPRLTWALEIHIIKGMTRDRKEARRAFLKRARANY